VLQTDQVAPHADLTDIVRRHQQNPWRKPCPAHTREAFEQFLQTHRRDPRPIVLDSFCGTGMSTAILAAQFPEAWVVGIDQSAHRLGKHQPTERRNYHLLRAEAEPFWCCLAEAGIRLHSHWLLYPNPWPKASQFKKRLHGHGAFPMLAQLGGALEMRTNWHLFAEEFALASDLIGLQGSIDMVSPAAPMTLFERKYQERGQTLWRFSGEFSN
jgi:tRNA (guanine-N7-)-methyltransferase